MAKQSRLTGNTGAAAPSTCSLCADAKRDLVNVLAGYRRDPEQGLRLHDFAVHWYVKPDEQVLMAHLAPTFDAREAMSIVKWWRREQDKRRPGRSRGPESWEWKMAELERQGLCDPVNVEQLAVEHFDGKVPEYVAMTLRMWRRALQKEAKRERRLELVR